MDNCLHWFYLCLAMLGVILAGLVMVFRYFIKLDRKGVVLESNDRQHEHQHHQNEEKIKKLEEKNGAEQRQINELKEQIKQLEKKINHE